MAALRLLAMVVIGALCAALGGCFETLASAFLAPESLAVQGASGGVQALANDSGTNLNGLGSLGNTASEVDNLISDYPDAANRGELSALKNQLDSEGGSSKPAATPYTGSINDSPEQRAPFDRRVTLTKENSRSSSDTLVIKPHVYRRRNGDQLQTTIEPTDLTHWQLPTYQIAQRGN